MIQYTITMKFRVEAEKATQEKIAEYADELSENIMNDTKLVYGNGIEILDVVVDDIENNIGDYEEDEDYFDFEED